MLMESTWNVGDARRLMLHADNTWSGSGGWLKTMKWAVGSRGGGLPRSPPWLWFILALPSMLVFITWPLSGLTMEITQGYRHAHVAFQANMTGFTYNNFNERSGLDTFADAARTWSSALDARVSGAGIVYTPEGFDRSQIAFLNQVPAVLPKDDGIATIFLAAQADMPIEGNNWGLLLQYNCRTVDHPRDFQILTKVDRSISSYPHLYNGTHEELLEDGSYILTVNKTKPGPPSDINFVAEFGHHVEPRPQQEPQRINDNCYFKEGENITGDYPGIHQDQIFEVALWQLPENYSSVLNKFPTSNNLSFSYNFSIDRNITDYFGTYDNRGFRGYSWGDYARKKPQPMTAIGVQCRASGSVGTADVDGRESIYSNFRRTDTPISKIFGRCA